ncbi:hypothetical protein sscle_12g091120 [Sclerotinia sclerotiorum 1980 UF-70]|uniref:Uncharacterized protein n=1 Tax=Sclerotinia sclerotiorum (strain ATCC 18683 / 1980 / Ss-1) TaxID=665079 RepID=A0A1D9QHS9_SCLS1|nr:hypothetical protein sscle_12g091120 [Sclerotinia sclerotiorum 1980 UF-70]
MEDTAPLSRSFNLATTPSSSLITNTFRIKLQNTAMFPCHIYQDSVVRAYLAPQMSLSLD